MIQAVEYLYKYFNQRPEFLLAPNIFGCVISSVFGMAAKLFLTLPGGIKFPTVGLGTLQRTPGLTPIDEQTLVTALNTALEAGYRHIDTAYYYRNEGVIGRVLKEWFSSGRLKREDIFVTTKLPLMGLHPDRLELFLKKSLESLQLDYVDLYLIHFPVGTKYIEGHPEIVEPEPTDHIATWKKMEEQVDAGRAKTIGLSNFNIKQIDRILKSARIKPACLQVELHVYLQQRELVNFCQRNGIAVTAYCALGSPGYNDFRKSINAEPVKVPDSLRDPVIKKVAEKHKKTNGQVMLRYLLQKDIVVVPKSTNPTRIKENIDVYNFSLDAEDMKSLDDLEIGEEARIIDFYSMKALSAHPEWPFEKK